VLFVLKVHNYSRLVVLLKCFNFGWRNILGYSKLDSPRPTNFASLQFVLTALGHMITRPEVQFGEGFANSVMVKLK